MVKELRKKSLAQADFYTSGNNDETDYSAPTYIRLLLGRTTN